MTQAEIDKAIKDAETQRKHIKALIGDSTATLKSLADTERQLHDEIDRKTKALEASKSTKHRTALKKLVGILEDDAKKLHKGIQSRKELQDKRRNAIKRLGDRIRRLRKRHGHSGTVSGIGPDVSVYQGSVNWDAVASKSAFGFCKATEGRTYTDPTWSSARRQAMLKSGIACGAYHFARPDVNSATDEAQHFVAAVKAAGGKFVAPKDWGSDGFVGALDFEHTPYSESWAKAWGEEFHRLTGVPALIYGGGYSLNPVLGALGAFDGVWIAAYASSWQPYFSGPDSAVKVWQYTSSGSIPGVSGGCDVSKTV